MSAVKEADFLDRAADIKAVRYVVVGTFPEKPASIGAVWFKGSQIRMETEINGVPVIIIQDSATSTQVNCLPLKKLTAQGEYDALNLTPVDLVHDLRESVAAITGSEKLDGKDCAVIEFTTKDGNKAKSWVWKEKGLLLKTVTEVPEGKEVIELKSLSFDNIPDSLFQTPANFQMVSEEELNIAASYTPSRHLQNCRRLPA